MARESASPQSAAPPHLGPNAPLGGTVASSTARRPSLAAATLCRHSSEIGAVCAKERSYGSVRGVLGNRHPYRDRAWCVFSIVRGRRHFRRELFRGLISGCCGATLGCSRSAAPRFAPSRPPDSQTRTDSNTHRETCTDSWPKYLRFRKRSTQHPETSPVTIPG